MPRSKPEKSSCRVRTECIGQLAKHHLQQIQTVTRIFNQNTPLVISQIPRVSTIVAFPGFQVSRRVFIATRVRAPLHMIVTAIISIDCQSSTH